ncbi:MAG: rhomboid family intramembrane serine protease [Phycisphaera sp.]|nr:rhomboid family intramembrane serine protease [Phycisphaera sp.]
MGMQDRDWYREDDPRRTTAGMGSPGDAHGELGVRLRGWSVTTWLLVINIAVFVIDAVLLGAGVGHNITYRFPMDGKVHELHDAIGVLDYWGYFSIDTLRQGQVWRVLTFQFLHANVMHILFNMIGLFFFGPMIEYYLGSKRFLAFYLLCGMAGAVAYTGLWSAGVLVHSSATHLVGASAGIFGILIGGAVVAPNSRVLIYGIIPMKLRTLAWLLVGVGAYTVLTRGGNAGGEAGHLGGALLGFVLINRPRWLDWADRIGFGGRTGPRAPRRAWATKSEKPPKPSRSEAEIDRILEKVSKQGLASLTDDEKRALAEDTERKRAGR